MNDEPDPMLDVPPVRASHRIDRPYAISLAVAVVAVVILVVIALWTTIHAQNRAEDSADRNAEVAELLRGQLAVALDQLAANDFETRCRATLAVKVDVAVLDNAIAFDNLLLTLSDDGADLAAVQAEVVAARDAMAAVRGERLATNQTCTGQT